MAGMDLAWFFPVLKSISLQISRAQQCHFTIPERGKMIDFLPVFPLLSGGAGRSARVSRPGTTRYTPAGNYRPCDLSLSCNLRMFSRGWSTV